jgi:hypothetical protein
MGDILKHIQELIDEGKFFTEKRPAYPLPNYFDAIDGCAAAGKAGEGGTDTEDDLIREQAKTSNPLRRGDNSTII